MKSKIIAITNNYTGRIYCVTPEASELGYCGNLSVIKINQATIFNDGNDSCREGYVL